MVVEGVARDRVSLRTRVCLMFTSSVRRHTLRLLSHHTPRTHAGMLGGLCRTPTGSRSPRRATRPGGGGARDVGAGPVQLAGGRPCMRIAKSYTMAMAWLSQVVCHLCFFPSSISSLVSVRSCITEPCIRQRPPKRYLGSRSCSSAFRLSNRHGPPLPRDTSRLG